ncbi:hypothetical protein BHM03_00010606 [Ensete ventricosum]|nr:hypothetical protein BHM03_00010606 [Ensete ventricosum]
MTYKHSIHTLYSSFDSLVVAHNSDTFTPVISLLLPSLYYLGWGVVAARKQGLGAATRMSGVELHHAAPKRRWDEQGSLHPGAATFNHRCGDVGTAAAPAQAPRRKLLTLSAMVDEAAASVVPPVTVVLEGRSICHRVYLDQHTGYKSLAKALRRMFVDFDGADGHGDGGDQDLQLANAVPGYVVAYEDMEDDLLLVGDLNWK